MFKFVVAVFAQPFVALVTNKVYVPGPLAVTIELVVIPVKLGPLH